MVKAVVVGRVALCRQAGRRAGRQAGRKGASLCSSGVVDLSPRPQVELRQVADPGGKGGCARRVKDARTCVVRGRQSGGLVPVDGVVPAEQWGSTGSGRQEGTGSSNLIA